MTIHVEVIETSSLGDRSYLAHDGHVAVVVDPQRDIDRVLALAGRLGVRVTHVVETHLHNDYVSGGLALARVSGAAYLVGGAEEVSFDRVPVADGERIAVSERMWLDVVSTPGHTFHHLSYVLAGSGGPEGVFTGGSLLFGGTGRTDLLGAEHARTLARHQHASARRLSDLLPDGARLWPTHGFGSFCAATPSGASASTIGREKDVNAVLRMEADDFVTHLLEGLDAYPAYYAHMGARNAAGAEPIDLTPARPADSAELLARLRAGEWVVDLRSRKAFADRHLAGTLSFGLDGPMATWLGWLVPWGTPLTLLGESAEQVAAAQRELARIGIDRPAAASTGTVEQWAGHDPNLIAGLTTATFADLAAARANEPAPARAGKPTGARAGEPTGDRAGEPASARAGEPAPARAGEPTGDRAGEPAPAHAGEPAGGPAVLDVRMGNEWRAGHVAGAVHIPLPELPGRLAEVPEGTVWVHCGSGYRAAAAASLLARSGRQVVHIDDAYSNAADAGLPITTSDEKPA